MSKETLTVVLLLTGLGLLVAGQFWQRDLGFNRGYTDEQAREFMEASRQWHSAMHAAAHSPEAEDADHAAMQAELEAVENRLEAARTIRDEALATRTFHARLITFGGLLLVIAGFVMAWRHRSQR
jgi:hypothetical protein